MSSRKRIGSHEESSDILCLTRDLCEFATAVVSPENERLFERVRQELPIRIHRYPSGSTYNGWLVPQEWRVQKATISKDGNLLFDGAASPLGVAVYSKSFAGELEWEDLRPHLVTNPELPEAIMYHCMWQYRPWDADWALCVPHQIYRTFGPGRYDIDLETEYEPGEMLVADYEHPGSLPLTIVLNAHTCHPCMANDDFAGVAVLIHLFRWLQGRKTRYTYRLVLGPEHLGTVFYLRDRSKEELERFVGGAFAEMPGTDGPLKLAGSLTGEERIDQVFSHAVHCQSSRNVLVPWRRGAGNDETVWEAPGYEVPFVEVSRSLDLFAPYREYHTSLDTPDLMDEQQLQEFFRVFVHAIEILENDATLHRSFDGLICLSNPKYDLYFERPDPAVSKQLEKDSEKWGSLLDFLFRYFDGSMTILDIAIKHDLSFERLYAYSKRFEEKGLVRFEPAIARRRPISRISRPKVAPHEDDHDCDD